MVANTCKWLIKLFIKCGGKNDVIIDENEQNYYNDKNSVKIEVMTSKGRL